MWDVYLIEVDGQAVGLVARDSIGEKYHFHAAVPRVFGIDNRSFETPEEARRAAREILGAKSKSMVCELDHAA